MDRQVTTMPDTYEILTPATVVEYVARNPALAAVLPHDRIGEVREVGDGNLNLVFILSGTDGPGIVLKQALPYVRLVGPDWPMTPDRATKEAEALRSHGALVPSLVPALYDYDAERYVLAMEDLSDHQVWRHALNHGERHEGVATDVGVYVAHVAFGTSVFGMAADAQKAALAAAVNPELCEITEDLVLTEPTRPAGRNSVIPANEPDAQDLIDDEGTVREMGWLKWQFMTQAEALIHGDLHTGSIMVRAAADGVPRSTKIFDSEFAFYGPVGFDLGLAYANYVIAAARAFALGEDERASWALGLLAETWDAFDTTFRGLWPRRVDARVFTDGTLEDFIAKVRIDGIGYGAAEAMRRIVGLAKTADIETLPEALREGAARGVLRASRMMATMRHADPVPASIAARAGEILLASRTR
jgi:5-methylthioribose kinase